MGCGYLCSKENPYIPEILILSFLGTDTRVLIIGKVWPEPDSSAAGRRMLELIRVFREEGCGIAFASAASDSEYSADLSSLQVEIIPIRLNHASFDDLISKMQPDIVLFDRFMTEEQFGWRVAEKCPDAIRILDTEDLHFLRKARQDAWKHSAQTEPDHLYNEVAKREVASILRCDLSLIISSYEMDLLRHTFGLHQDLLLYLPFLLEELSKEDIKQWEPYDKREHFISIGNFLHEPNWNAVRYLKEDIWPLIYSELPEVELHIYGAYPSKKVEQLHDPKTGFLIKGRADDARKVVGQSRILLAPLRFGAGLKGKLVEAMQSGTPSITTEIGAEGMQDGLPWPGYISNEPEEFARHAVALYQSKKMWEECQLRGAEIINQLFNRSRGKDRMLKAINELGNDLKAHRQQNFIGSILQHHTLASTKYMSKWIEEKNRS